jgi:hypothetical protein
MRKATLLIAILGLALMLNGCRDITTDLHDIYTITLYPGITGAVDGKRTITLQTDVNGRLSSLPDPQGGKWVFECDEIDEWGYPHHEHWVWQDTERECDDFCSARCEFLGCDKYQWIFMPDPDTYIFAGWFTSGGTLVTNWTSFNNDTPVFARWLKDENGEPVEGSAAYQLAELRRRPGLPPSITIEVNADEVIRPQVLDFGGRPITITLKAGPGVVPVEILYKDEWNINSEYRIMAYNTLQLGVPGAMFTVRRGVTLIIENVKLMGFFRNTFSTIVVEDGGKVIIRDNAILRDNTAHSPDHGGAITVNKGGLLEMESGLINSNMIFHPRLSVFWTFGGGGVWVRGGDFVMSGGNIYFNFAVWGGGGGVRVSHGGTFTMNRNPGTIDPTPNVPGSGVDLCPLILENWSAFGAGVHVSGGEDPSGSRSVFTMNSGRIEENWGPLWGAGVAVGVGGRFNMFGGDILLNEGGDGVGIDNDDSVYIYDGWVWINQSVRGMTGGVSNWGHLEMWGGLIGVNEGGFGGGIRNFGYFGMFEGDILGNIGNGGPGGGIFNLGDFQMHGGSIAHNMSNTSQGGGIFHGTAGDPYAGRFLITGGMIWNNRDFTHYHHNVLPANLLPNSMGNIRRNTGERSMVLARPGFFSLNAADRPAGWQSVTGRAPVFVGGDPDALVPTNPSLPPHTVTNPLVTRQPTRWENIFWFIPPALNPPPVNQEYPSYMHFSIGRPRIEINTVNNPTDEPVINYDLGLEAISGRGADIRANRGGTWFPSSVQVTHPNATNDGFAWIARRGFLEPMGMSWVLVGSALTPLTIPEWPTPPTLGFIDFFSWIDERRPLSAAEAWPWVEGPLPMLLPQQTQEPVQEHVLSEDHPKIQQLLHRRPDLFEILNQRVADVPMWPVLPMETQLEHRRQLYIPDHIRQKMDEIVETMLERQRNGWESGGAAPFGSRHR